MIETQLRKFAALHLLLLASAIPAAASDAGTLGASTKSTNDLKQLRWHFLNNPAFNAGSNSWVETEGSSKLFGQTFSRSSLLSSNLSVLCPDDPGGALVYRITTQNAIKATNVTYVTALQSAPASTASMVATASVRLSDNRMEGVQMGPTWCCSAPTRR